MAEVDAGAVAPVVPVTPAADAAPAPESTADQAVAESTDQPAAPDTQKDESERAFQKRLGIEKRRLERALRAEIERDFFKSQLETRDRPQQATQAQGEPQQKDFTDYEEYLLARAEWRFEQKQAKQRETQQRETQTQQQQRSQAERAHFVQQNLVAKGVAKYPDFNEAVLSDPDVPITEVMVASAARLANGADVIYHLAKNDPEELLRISRLPDVEQVWEIKDAASKLTASPAPTRTPAPIVPNAGKASVRKDTFELSVNNDAEWKEFLKRRHKELGRR